MIYRCVNVAHDRVDKNTFTSHAHLSSSWYTFLSLFSLFPLCRLSGVRCLGRSTKSFQPFHSSYHSFNHSLFFFHMSLHLLLLSHFHYFTPLPQNRPSCTRVRSSIFSGAFSPDTTFRAILRFAVRSSAHHTNKSITSHSERPTCLCFFQIIFVIHSKKNREWYKKKKLKIPGVKLQHVSDFGRTEKRGGSGKTVCPAKNENRNGDNVPPFRSVRNISIRLVIWFAYIRCLIILRVLASYVTRSRRIISTIVENESKRILNIKSFGCT